MNATVNNATSQSVHFTISGRHPNILLPKLPRQKVANDKLIAYGMQINALLKQTHQRIDLADNEADHKIEISLKLHYLQGPNRNCR